MRDPEQAGKVYHFDHVFMDEPRHYGTIELWQVGELYGSAGYEVALHQQSCCEISCILSGSGVFEVDGKPYPVGEGDIFINSLPESHAIHFHAPSGMRYLYVGFKIHRSGDPKMDRLADFFEHPGPVRCRKDGCGVAGGLTRLLEEIDRDDDFSAFLTEHFLAEALALACRCFTQRQQAPRQPFPDQDAAGNIVCRILRFVDANAAQITEVREIAAALDYSPAYLSHVFRKKMGLTLQQYLARKKIELGEELLRTGRYSVTQIAMLLGYGTLQSFSKAFRRIRGMAPGDCTPE